MGFVGGQEEALDGGVAEECEGVAKEKEYETPGQEMGCD